MEKGLVAALLSLDLHTFKTLLAYFNNNPVTDLVADISDRTAGSFPWSESSVLPHAYADLSARCGCSSVASAAASEREGLETPWPAGNQVTADSAPL